MRNLGRSLLIAFLITALVEVPVMAAPTAPLGMVLQAQGALLDKALAVDGATIYPGDRLETATDGAARLRIGAGQVYLLGSSAATLSGTSAGLIAELSRGTAGFSSAAGENIEVRAAQAVIRPKGSQPTHARVTVVSPTELVVTTYRGATELQAGDETYTLAEDTSYRVQISDDQDKDQSTVPVIVGTKSIHSTHIVLILIGAAGVVGITVWGLLKALESPNHP